MESTTTLNIEFGLRRKYYIKGINLGDYTLFSTQRSYHKFQCLKHLSYFCVSPLEALLQYIIFSTNVRVTFFSLFLKLNYELSIGTCDLSY
jgi:hypothetical protein